MTPQPVDVPPVDIPPVETQARTLAGYADASRLRQVHDRDWVLDQVTGAPRTLVDLGSGIGQLLQAALDRFPSLERAVGLERSPHRIAEATTRLSASADRVELHEADLTTPGPISHRPDVVTMTSVLHWLYPHEDRIFTWVREHLAPDGSFLLTTYHPEADAAGLGGEDDIVRDALTDLGIGRTVVPARFTGHGILPIATRTRTTDDLHALLERHFTVAAVHDRDAVVSGVDAPGYARFHAATFGDYYARLVEPARRPAFFRAVGAAAARRQDERGHVSSMTVRLWRLAHRG
ncbi:class I SAM-dependent methyltransferase [Streptomyces sp. NPDC060194]|uniref:class I SAM-dependent methyltransferase n=1 Tax=Streptomyces sp. NPDC060194 TaxID=3347069 RepID=UPI0036490947